jgi:hypothetical protein
MATPKRTVPQMQGLKAAIDAEQGFEEEAPKVVQKPKVQKIN